MTVGLTKGRKYVYVKINKGSFIKVRLFLRGAEEPGITSSMEAGKDYIILKPELKKPGAGSVALALEDLPANVKEAILKAVSG